MIAEPARVTPVTQAFTRGPAVALEQLDSDEVEVELPLTPGALERVGALLVPRPLAAKTG